MSSPLKDDASTLAPLLGRAGSNSVARRGLEGGGPPASLQARALSSDRGRWANTANGNVVYPRDPRASEIDPDDIAQSLARICRFNGHLKRGVWHYSVAHHSVLVSYLCEPRNALIGLLHDAHEAFLGDIIRPAQELLGRRWESATVRWQVAIANRFGLPPNALYELPADVKLADEELLATERRDLCEHRDRDWGLKAEPLAMHIDPWPAEVSYRYFMSRLEELAPEAMRGMTEDQRRWVP